MPWKLGIRWTLLRTWHMMDTPWNLASAGHASEFGILGTRRRTSPVINTLQDVEYDRHTSEAGPVIMVDRPRRNWADDGHTSDDGIGRTGHRNGYKHSGHALAWNSAHMMDTPHRLTYDGRECTRGQTGQAPRKVLQPQTLANVHFP